ncbi:2-oxoadipate dioxygenase/decarboxylase family protein, partial [Escherichia coli]
MANSITADEIREQFSQAMSAMYQQEVPQYGTLLELVADVNLAVLENNPQPVSYTHLRAHETRRHRVCRLRLEKG